MRLPRGWELRECRAEQMKFLRNSIVPAVMSAVPQTPETSKKKPPKEKTRIMISQEYIGLLADREEKRREMARLESKILGFEKEHPWLPQLRGQIFSDKPEKKAEGAMEPPKKKLKVDKGLDIRKRDAVRQLLEFLSRCSALRMKEQKIPWDLVEKTWKVKMAAPGVKGVPEIRFFDESGQFAPLRPPDADKWILDIAVATPDEL